MSRRSIRIATDRYKKKCLENNGLTLDLDSSDSEDPNGIGREVDMVGVEGQKSDSVGQQVDGEGPEVDGVAEEVGGVLGQEVDAEVDKDEEDGTKRGEEDDINERMSAFEQGLKEVKEEISIINKSLQSAAKDRIYLYNLISKK